MIAEIEIDAGATFNEKFIPLICGDISARITCISGGRGSGKSFAVAQSLVIDALQRRARYGLVRKVFDTIRESQWRQIKEIVELWGLEELFEFRVAPLSIRCAATGSEFVCRGLDRASKIKSIAGLDRIWIEEAEEITREDWLTMNLSIRGETQKRIDLTFNPQAGSWLQSTFFRSDGGPKRSDVYYLHTTFHDNRFVGAEFAAEMDLLRRENEELYRLHGLGEWVTPEGLIYKNWAIINELPERKYTIFYGLDFGYFPDPAVLVRVSKTGNEYFIEELLYENNLTNPMLAERMREAGITGGDIIYADSAEPKSIQELIDHGFFVQSVPKGADSVRNGIQLAQSKKLYLLSDSVNAIREISNYTLRKDASGEYMSGRPVEKNDHAMDAMRYAIVGDADASSGLNFAITEG